MLSVGGLIRCHTQIFAKYPITAQTSPSQACGIERYTASAESANSVATILILKSSGGPRAASATKAIGSINQGCVRRNRKRMIAMMMAGTNPLTCHAERAAKLLGVSSEAEEPPRAIDTPRS